MRFVALCLMLISAPCFAVTINASSCSRTDVVSALTTASSETGDVIVQLPACSATSWSSAVSISTASGFDDVTSITLRGYGTPSSAGSTGSTIITGSGIDVTSSAGKKIVVSNLTISGQIAVSGTGRPANGGGWVVNHVTFSGANDRVIWVSGRTYGVIANSVLNTSFAVIVGIREQVDSDGGNASWARAPSFGTAEAVYIESNSMTYTPNDGVVHMCVDGDGGSRFVFRYNTTTNCYAGAHDASSISNVRSAYSWEIYSNTMTTTRSYASGLGNLRGGTGYYFNNDLIGTDANPFYGNEISLTNYRSFDYADGSPWTTSCNETNKLRICTNSTQSAQSCTTDANCGGVSGACEFADDPAGDGSGHPCRDQIGRSTDMASRPALFWNNRLKTGGGSFGPVYPAPNSDGRVQVHIVLNRDYCQAQSTMPTTCNGVTTDYSAYTYPHPLLSEEAVIRPNDPTNIVVTQVIGQ